MKITRFRTVIRRSGVIWKWAILDKISNEVLEQGRSARQATALREASNARVRLVKIMPTIPQIRIIAQKHLGKCWRWQGIMS